MNQDDEFDLDLAIPDLEMPGAPAPSAPGAGAPPSSVGRPASSQAAPPSPAAPPQSGGGADFDFGDSLAPPGGPSLDLDTGGFDSGGGDDFNFGDGGEDGFGFDTDDDFETFGASSLSGSQQDLAEMRQETKRKVEEDWPTGKAIDPESIEIDPVEVQVFANFGKAPKNPILAPKYSYRVWERKRELLGELVEAETRVQEAERFQSQTLTRVVEEERTAVEKNESYKRMLEQLGKLEQMQEERAKALASANAAYAGQVKTVEAEQAKNKATIAKYQGERQKYEQALAQREEFKKRADGQYKRILIQARGLKLAEREAQEQGKRIDNRAELSALSAQAAPLKEQLDQASAAVEKVRGALRKIDGNLSKLRSHGRKLKKKRDQVDKDFEHVLDVRNGSVNEVEGERLAILAEVGRSVLQGRGQVPVSAETLEAIRQADKRVNDELYQQRLRVLAIDAYDPKAFKLGIQVGATGAVLLVALLGTLMFGGEPEQPEVEYYEDGTPVGGQ